MTTRSGSYGNEEQDDDSEGEGARTDTDDEGIERDADPTPRAARGRRRPPAPRLADIVQVNVPPTDLYYVALDWQLSKCFCACLIFAILALLAM
ncbi:unnamed protein product [Leptidea sinapis]|uniref:Uncharacterized protein n=1 Tax=Leptidea sinapis TaxID=189913 RepID=A0A5E4QUC9_9NEOP|nr:unnamed protein product [Leptidea sinapis]